MTTPHSGYGDLPATEDELGFAPSAKALAAIIGGADLADTPLTVGIYGPWGSGKTSLMGMSLAQLDPQRCTTVWFDAWRYTQSDALWRALLLRVVETLRTLVEHDTDWLRAYIDHRNRLDPSAPQTALDSEGFRQTRAALTARLDDLGTSLYRSVDREEPGEIQFQWDAAGKLAANAVIRAGFSFIPVLGQMSKAVEAAGGAAGEEDYSERLFSLFQRERTRIYREQVQSLEQFHQGLAALVKELVSDLDRRLVVFIDDLDRCLPEQAIGVLEAIKVFLDIQGCVFVLGVDREIIEQGIRVRYKEFALSGTSAGPFPVAERDYLEKIVQVPFTLPPLAPVAISTFLDRRLPAVEGLSDDEHRQVAELMTTGLLRNPRKVKRSFNIFRLHLILDRVHGRRTPAGLIAKLTVIQSSFADLYERIARDPTLLRSIEAIARGTPGAAPIPQELRDEMGRQDQRLREMLHQMPWYEELSDDELRELVYQSRITGEAGRA
ncbi:MAG: KAP family NTPase [Chloroflexales bacterium]|nr:KAP family NTPase [Chloroflexales bacterium]